MMLGGLWLLDGALQFQPYMFTKAFFAGILGMANMGLPGLVSTADYRVASLLAVHPAAWNAIFATLQVLLGVGLLWRRTAWLARPLSIPWALGVWVIGEGFGGLFMGGSSLLTGAPGPALLYAVLAVVLSPQIPERRRVRFGVSAWALVWCGSALLELETVNHLPGVPAAQIKNGGYNQPTWLGALDRAVGNVVGRRGTELAIGLGVAAALIGIGGLVPAWRRAALRTGAILAAVLGVVGQNLGSIATGQGTDPGTGPLLVLLALALWPVSAQAVAGIPGRREASRKPARALVPAVPPGTLRRPAALSLSVVILSAFLAACSASHQRAVTATTVFNGGGVAPGTTTTTVRKATRSASTHRTTRTNRASTTRSSETTITGTGAGTPISTIGPTATTSGPIGAAAPSPGSRPNTATTARPAPTTTAPRPPAPTTTTTTRGPADVAVSILANCAASSFCYSPADLTVHVGQTVVWTNSTQAPHTVTSCTTSACSGVGPGSGSPMNSPFMNPGQIYSVQFTTPGTYNYYCQIHGYPVMHGTITVVA
jgi:plastocyanin